MKTSLHSYLLQASSMLPYCGFPPPFYPQHSTVPMTPGDTRATQRHSLHLTTRRTCRRPCSHFTLQQNSTYRLNQPASQPASQPAVCTHNLRRLVGILVLCALRRHHLLQLVLVPVLHLVCTCAQAQRRQRKAGKPAGRVAGREGGRQAGR